MKPVRFLRCLQQLALANITNTQDFKQRSSTSKLCVKRISLSTVWLEAGGARVEAERPVWREAIQATDDGTQSGEGLRRLIPDIT